jgi:hypothetical protein
MRAADFETRLVYTRGLAGRVPDNLAALDHRGERSAVCLLRELESALGYPSGVHVDALQYDRSSSQNRVGRQVGLDASNVSQPS